MSQDGRNWARIEGPHHTGALFDVGAEGEWDQLYIGSPQVTMRCLGLRLVKTRLHLCRQQCMLSWKLLLLCDPRALVLNGCRPRETHIKCLHDTPSFVIELMPCGCMNHLQRL